jgi:N12 class adenine-specific DNA methylase
MRIRIRDVLMKDQEHHRLFRDSARLRLSYSQFPRKKGFLSRTKVQGEERGHVSGLPSSFPFLVRSG